MERIGIFGGSFDPPHEGHIRAAVMAAEALGLTKLLLIPTRISPHKPQPLLTASPRQRLEMLHLAAKGTGLELCDLELQREGPSYTCHTVQALREQYPRAELVLLMGSDMFLSFRQWKDYADMLSQVQLGVFCRGIPGERSAIAQQMLQLEAEGARVCLLDNPVTDISSTQLRRLLVFRGAGAFLKPEVEQYIRENALYGTGRDYRNLPAEELERVVVSLLKPNRIAHVLGCRQTAVELAKRWGADPVDAERAALLHDITKALDGQLQLNLCQAYGVDLDSFSRKNPKTLHALTGSLVAERIFGENQAVVDAICCHTTGKANMNMLEMIIYVADYMEPNRDFPGVEDLRYLTTVDMKLALAKGLQMTVAVLKEKGSDISPESRQALESLGQPV